MKNLFLGALLICFSIQTSAQDFNKWSVDLGAGVHKPVFPISSGYGTDTPDFWQANIGGRYMINEKFGLRVDFGFNQFSEGDDGKAFDTDYYRGTIEAVVNAGEILGFRDWTQRFNVLVHGGFGLSDIKTYNPNTSKDRTVNVVLGVTPQFKLTDRVALFLDASAIGHLYQNTSFDGNGGTSRRGFNGGIFNASIGLNIYLGKNKVHADWYTKSDKIAEDDTNELEMLENRLKAAEVKIAKLNGVKGDYNKTGLISELDGRYTKKGSNTNSNNVTIPNVDFVKNLINKGYVNVYFDVSKSTVQNGSMNAINYLRQYMLENPSVNAELNGYADETGTKGRNKILSDKRAKRVFDILVAAGINGNRLSHIGNGEDTSITSKARQLARRVTFRIK